MARRELFWRTKVESAAPLKPVEPEIMFIGSSSWSFRRWWINRIAICRLSASRFEKPDVLIVICVQIAVTASASNALQRINDNEFCVRMLRQKLLDLLFQPMLERVSHDRKVQRRRGIFRQVKESRLDTRWNESSRLRYSASPCVVAKFQSACPCATHKQSHKASHDLPIFGAPARMCKPSGMSSSTRNVRRFVVWRALSDSSAVMVSSLVHLFTSFRFYLI